MTIITVKSDSPKLQEFHTPRSLVSKSASSWDHSDQRKGSTIILAAQAPNLEILFIPIFSSSPTSHHTICQVCPQNGSPIGLLLSCVLSPPHPNQYHLTPGCCLTSGPGPISHLDPLHSRLACFPHSSNSNLKNKNRKAAVSQIMSGSVHLK